MLAFGEPALIPGSRKSVDDGVAYTGVLCSLSSHHRSPSLSSETRWILPSLHLVTLGGHCFPNGPSESTRLFLCTLAPLCTRVFLPALPRDENSR